MIHRFLRLPDERRLPPFPYMAGETFGYTVWLMGDPTLTPVRIPATNYIAIGSPMLNPVDANEMVFATVEFGSGRVSTVYLVDLAANSAQTVIAITDGASDPHPYFSPDGTKIVYRTSTGSPVTSDEVWEIRVIDKDGTNDTLLYTYTTGGTFSQALSSPCFSPSGDYIAFGKGRAGVGDEVWIMNADGSGASAVATTGGDTSGLQWTTPYCFLSWAHSSDVLGWMDMQAGGAPTNASVWRKVNGDGSGLTTLLSTPHASSPLVRWMGSSRFCWLADDSGMVSYKVDATSNPRWRLAKIAADGSGDSWIGSHFSNGSGTANPYGQTSWTLAPTVYPLAPNGDGRIYWTPFGASGSAQIQSVLPDGSDLRTDEDGSASPTHSRFGFVTGFVG